MESLKPAMKLVDLMCKRTMEHYGRILASQRGEAFKDFDRAVDCLQTVMKEETPKFLKNEAPGLIDAPEPLIKMSVDAECLRMASLGWKRYQANEINAESRATTPGFLNQTNQRMT